MLIFNTSKYVWFILQQAEQRAYPGIAAADWGPPEVFTGARLQGWRRKCKWLKYCHNLLCVDSPPWVLMPKLVLYFESPTLIFGGALEYRIYLHKDAVILPTWNLYVNRTSWKVISICPTSTATPKFIGIPDWEHAVSEVFTALFSGLRKGLSVVSRQNWGKLNRKERVRQWFLLKSIGEVDHTNLQRTETLMQFWRLQ